MRSKRLRNAGGALYLRDYFLSYALASITTIYCTIALLLLFHPGLMLWIAGSVHFSFRPVLLLWLHRAANYKQVHALKI
jgi:hypothetical protein